MQHNKQLAGAKSVAAILAVGLFAAVCTTRSDSGTKPATDGGVTDAGIDAGAPDGTDGGSGTDASIDASIDASTDAGADAGADAGLPTFTGTMKLFFTANANGPPTDAGNPLLSATSTNGINFTLESDIWMNEPYTAMGDPVVLRGSSGRWLFARYSTIDGGILISHNDTSPNFTGVTADTLVPNGQVPGILETPTGYRVYYFFANEIRSVFSSDGIQWAAETGTRLSAPPDSGLAMVGDPAPVRRANGTYVLYVKASAPPDADPSPYDHMIYRATSADGLTFSFENKMLVNHASVPGAYADSTGRVWVYYLDFTNSPAQRESVSVVFENDDFTLSTPRAIQFDTLPTNTWANNPGPVRIP
jgi:hypothetical protein